MGYSAKIVIRARFSKQIRGFPGENPQAGSALPYSLNQTDCDPVTGAQVKEDASKSTVTAQEGRRKR